MAARSRSMFVIVALVIVLVFAALYFQASRREFILEVVNQSAQQVDQVTLSGSALKQPAVLVALAPGATETLQVAIKDRGTLRFAASQGMTRADAAIVEDTRLLESLHQRLVIEEGNRFLLSRVVEE